MWFLGLILGLILGSFFNGETSIVMGVTGLVAGLLYSQKQKIQNKPSDSRLDLLERRVNHLESELAALRQNSPTHASSPMQEAIKSREPDVCPVTPELRPIAPEFIPLEIPTQPSADIPEAIPAHDAPVSPHSKTIVEHSPKPAPMLFDKALQWLLTGENAIARLGIVVLFIGIGFLVKYAAEHAHFPVEFRLVSAVLVAIVLLVFGWRMRNSHATYALILQGGGIGILYITVYGAYQVWHLIPGMLAFPLLFGIAVLSTLLAVWQNSMVLAVFGVTGGFLAPLLTATETGNHVALFGYYTVLNLGIFATAWFRSWRILNLLGFVFTFVIALIWGTQNYRPELFASTEPFLILFFLLYVGIALLYALKRAPDLKNYIDGGLIFGVPVAGFGLQAALVSDFEYGLAISSLVLGTFYMALSRFIQLRRRDDLGLLVEVFLALGIIFASLSIPLAFDAKWTSAAWAVEGAGIFWFGCRMNKIPAWRFGLLLQAGAGTAFMLHVSIETIPPHPINHLLLGAWLIALAGLFCYRIASQKVTLKLLDWISPLFFWGLGWWLYGGLNNIEQFATFDHQATLGLLFLTATTLLGSWLTLRWKWVHGVWLVWAFTPVLYLVALYDIDIHGHPFAHYGWLAWALSLIAHYRMLYQHESKQLLTRLNYLHTAAFLLLAALGAWEMHWLSGEYDLRHNAWSVASLIIVPLGLLLTVSRAALERFWPLNQHLDAYRQYGALPIAGALWLWTFYANLTQDGSSQPLPYFPLLNAIDIGHGLILMSVGLWLMQIRNTALYNQTLVFRIGGAALFVWLNAMLLRSIHHWTGVGYYFNTMMDSTLVQTALSLFWTLLSMALMITAARLNRRTLWLVGATLMGVVLIKLLLIDLEQSGTLERIFSFTGVGLLMLLIGYYAPPPKKGIAA